MFLSRLEVDVTSRAFRRDYADVHDMHRTVLSAFPALPPELQAREEHGVLWRLDNAGRGYVLYVQSRTHPDWAVLPDGYLRARAQVRCLQPVSDAICAGRSFAFRLVASPTRSIHPDGGVPGHRGRGKRVPVRTPERQLDWLAAQGERHGFRIPGTSHGPDVAPTPSPQLVGRKKAADGGDGRRKITISPVRFDGHLDVVDPEAFTAALHNGIGRAKAYGCGLLTLAPTRATA
ncbi:type I-E CRISPR-associated protein Cas6/Cse3/CasE [Saccharopolyspora sp. NPDC047091]|uniref:type I-E CRISPR-associated protein Cas6/Cse3/CasE n=1 Tax=Saccharopolyspora sp. NPDC047091 TaxID=3155924 RepID=UPI0033EFB3C6